MYYRKEKVFIKNCLKFIKKCLKHTFIYNSAVDMLRKIVYNLNISKGGEK